MKITHLGAKNHVTGSCHPVHGESKPEKPSPRPWVCNATQNPII